MKTAASPCSSPPAATIGKQLQTQPLPPLSLTGGRSAMYALATAFLILVAVLYGEDLACILGQPLQQFSQVVEEYGQTAGDVTAIIANDAGKADDGGSSSKKTAEAAGKLMPLPFAVGTLEEDDSSGSSCDLFSGKWVLDETSRPHYSEEECPYIKPQLTCRKMGRPDDKYQKWRWRPHGCNIPSFNASFMLEKIRGKRVLYVGDSLNRGQYTSLLCLLHREIPPHAKSFHVNGSMTTFCAKDYNVTIQFYWAPFLAESNSDNAIVHRISKRIIRAGSVRKHGVYWKGADIIVFNTYMWWMTGESIKILRGPFSGDMKNIRSMEVEDAYRIALRTMVRWVEKNMDPNSTRVFFTSMSPAHERSAEWGDKPGGNCLNQTEPIDDPTYWGFSSSKSVMRVLGEELARSRVPFSLLNITQLSDYRKDAHTSIYKKQWNPLTPEQLANPKSYADCVHWCLPGLQDTWNELLYSKLFFP